MKQAKVLVGTYKGEIVNVIKSELTAGVCWVYCELPVSKQGLLYSPRELDMIGEDNFGEINPFYKMAKGQ